eukprot:346815-Pleurochrysis_carterae.AAC.3
MRALPPRLHFLSLSFTLRLPSPRGAWPFGVAAAAAELAQVRARGRRREGEAEVRWVRTSPEGDGREGVG